MKSFFLLLFISSGKDITFPFIFNVLLKKILTWMNFFLTKFGHNAKKQYFSALFKSIFFRNLEFKV